MKNLFLTIAVIAIIGLVSCNKEELADIERDVISLQDSLDIVLNQHNALLDSVSTLIEIINNSDTVDVKAIKMGQIGSLFEAIARQPEASYNLIDATKLLYSDYTELLPFSDKTTEQRGVSLSYLFDAIARQPEAFGKLDTAATIFLGHFNPLYMSNDIAEGKARGLAFYGLFSGIARQPEAFPLFDSTATKYLGDYNSSYISDEILEVSKAYAMSGLNEGLARQPEADSLFNLVCIKYFNFNYKE